MKVPGNMMRNEISSTATTSSLSIKAIIMVNSSSLQQFVSLDEEIEYYIEIIFHAILKFSNCDDIKRNVLCKFPTESGITLSDIMNRTNKRGDTPLLVCVLNNLYNMTKFLLSNCEVNIYYIYPICNHYNILFHLIDQCNVNVDLLNLLFEYDYNQSLLYHRDEYNQTIFHIASHRNHVDIIRYLLDIVMVHKKQQHHHQRYDDIINVVDIYGCTPLHKAIYCNHIDTVEILSNKGNCNELIPLVKGTITKKSLLPIDIARKYQYTSIIKLITSVTKQREIRYQIYYYLLYEHHPIIIIAPNTELKKS